MNDFLLLTILLTIFSVSVVCINQGNFKEYMIHFVSIYMKSFCWESQNCPLYMGVRIKRLSVGRASKLYFTCMIYSELGYVLAYTGHSATCNP